MSTIGIATGMVAPYYNLVLAAIVFFLFIKLLKEQKGKKVRATHWKLLLTALIIFLIEEGMTILKHIDIIWYPQFINGFFEVTMVCLFIYMALAQRDYIKKRYSKK